MEFSSPSLPAATPNNPYNGGIESLIKLTTKRPNRGRDNIDDSSSVTSMSSTNPKFEAKCCLCKGPETPLSKPLVRCSKCRRRWHEYCHKPAIEDPKSKDWYCRHCTDKMNTSSRPSPTAIGSMAFPVPSPSLTSESSKESNNMKARYDCEAPGCTQFFFHKPSKSKILCAIHEAEDRFNKSKAKPMASKTPSAPKPFRKAKLYPVKPDEGMKPLKRKRASTGKRGTTSNDHDLDSMETGLEKPQQLEMTNPLVSGPPVVNMTPIRTPRERARNFPFSTSMGSNKSPNEGDIARSLGSASMAESPIEPPPVERSNIDWEANNVLPNLARRTPQLLEQEPLTESPEYEPPPPPTLGDSVNPWVTEEDRDDSLGSQIAQELRANVNPNEAPKMVPPIGIPKAYRSPYATAPPPIEEQSKEKTATVQSNLLSAEILMTSSSEDQEMPDVDSLSLANIANETSPHVTTATSFPQQQTALPITTAVLSGTNSESTSTSMNFETEESGPEPDPDSIEAKRRQKAAAYDPSVLDSFLKKQRDADPDVQPSAQELAKTQIWGHIDPRVVWPKEYSAEWLAEKRCEIDARGGKKAHFGKLLTAQVRKERKDKGWDIHQTKEIVYNERTEENKRHLEELLGLKGIDEFEPGVRNGQLVMIEKMVDENGKRKRKGAPKIYSV